MTPASPTTGIIDALTQLGPCLSSDVAQRLVQGGVSEVAARKAIQRAKAPVERLPNINFPHNRQFLYLIEQFQSEDFWQKLVKAFDVTGSVYGYAFNGVLAHGGIVPKSHFSKVSGLANVASKQLSPGFVLGNMLVIGLLEQIEIDGIGECIQVGRNTPFSRITNSRFKSTLLAEDIFINGLKEWIKNNGLGSFNKVETRNGDFLPQFANANWDLTAPSYILPLLGKTETGLNPGFITSDIILGKHLSKADIGHFIHKSIGINSRGKNRPFVPFLVATSFSNEAFKFGRSVGMVMATPGTLLGDDIAEGLKALIGVLENAAANAAERPEVIGELFSKLARIEGAAGNLRGPLFEMLVGHCVREIDSGSIDIGVDAVNEKGEKADIDVLRVKGKQEIYAYECKGIGSSKTVPVADVEKWLGKTIPRIFDWIQCQERFRGVKVGFEFWTSGELSKETIAMLEARKANTQRYSIGWKNGSDVFEYVKILKSARIEAIFNEHYLKHPLSQ